MRPPAPQPPFRCRRDLRRIALRRAHGLSVPEIARIERATPEEIAAMLAQPGYAQLVEAHRQFTGLDVEARLMALCRVALDLLQLRLLAGDVRAAIFFAREMQAGRDPSRSLAEAVVAAAQRQGLRVAAKAPDALDLDLVKAAQDRRRALPMPAEPEAPAEPEIPAAPSCPSEARRLATDLGAARAEADRMAETFESRLAATRRRLVAELSNEAERAMTAPLEAASPAATRRLYKGATRRAERAAAAAKGPRTVRLTRHGPVAEQKALRRFAERSCIEARLALVRQGPPTSPAAEAARRLAVWSLPPP